MVYIYNQNLKMDDSMLCVQLLYFVVFLYINFCTAIILLKLKDTCDSFGTYDI